MGTATGYGMGGQGIESRWGRHCPNPYRPALGLNQPPIQRITTLSLDYRGWNVTLANNPYLEPRLKKK